MTDGPPSSDDDAHDSDPDASTDGQGLGTSDGVPDVAAATGRELARLDETFLVLDHLKVPGAFDAEIDHLVLGPTGVWLIGTLDGTTTVDPDDRLDDADSPIADEVDTVQWQAEHAAARLGTAVNPVLCLVGAALPRPAQMVRRTRVVQLDALVDHIASGPRILVPADLRPLEDAARTMADPSPHEPDLGPAAHDVPLAESAPPIWSATGTGRAAMRAPRPRLGVALGCLVVALLVVVVVLAIVGIAALARTNGSIDRTHPAQLAEPDPTPAVAPPR